MLSGLRQFVPSEVCLACDGCCRFKEENSSWRPKITSAEIGQIKTGGLAAEILTKNPFGSDSHIKTVSCNGQHHCSFFNSEGNTCRIYQQRPFECQLYPFVLSRNSGKAGIFVHLNCPFIQQTRHKPEFEKYVVYLKKFFQTKDTVDLIQENPELIGDYSAYGDELEYLFSLP